MLTISSPSAHSSPLVFVTTTHNPTNQGELSSTTIVFSIDIQLTIKLATTPPLPFAPPSAHPPTPRACTLQFCLHATCRRRYHHITTLPVSRHAGVATRTSQLDNALQLNASIQLLRIHPRHTRRTRNTLSTSSALLTTRKMARTKQVSSRAPPGPPWPGHVSHLIDSAADLMPLPLRTHRPLASPREERLPASSSPPRLPASRRPPPEVVSVRVYAAFQGGGRDGRRRDRVARGWLRIVRGYHPRCSSPRVLAVAISTPTTPASTSS